MPFMALAAVECLVRAVQPIQDSHHTVALVELEVVVVVSFIGGKEGHMVATVGVDGVQDTNGVPQQGDGEVRAHDQWSRKHGEEVGNVVLHWVGIDGSYSRGSCPLVVDLVDVFVESGVVE